MVPSASVIIPARNAAGTLRETLDALAAQELDLSYEVLVVIDDTSEDETAAIARDHPACSRVLSTRELGAGAMRNLGAEAAGAPVLAFTDADCAPAADWLRIGLEAIESRDIVQGAVLPMHGRPLGPFDRTLGVVSEYGLYETANLFVRADVFRRLGGFEDLFATNGRPFGEDSWFVWRSRRSGARVGFERSAVVHHAIFPGTRRGYVLEHARRRHFPALVRLIPELRGTFLYRRWFLSSRTAAFDAALAAALLAVRARSPVPLVASLPYVLAVLKDLRRWSGNEQVSSVELASALIVADAVGCGALLIGSVSARAPVL